jgi:hypothetical protein
MTKTLASLGADGTNGVDGADGADGADGQDGADGTDGVDGAGATTYVSFQKNTDNSAAGFYADSRIIIGWDGYDEIIMRQPLAVSGVYATGLLKDGGSYPSSQSMLLSTISNDFYQNSAKGQIEFTVSCDSDNTHPFYKVRFIISSSSGFDYCYATVEKSSL